MKSRIRYVARFLRWLDRRREIRKRPGITPYQALLYQTCDEYRRNHPYRPQM